MPAALAARAEDVSIDRVDVCRFKGWLLRPIGKRRGTVVLVHGWGQDSVRMAPLGDADRGARDRGAARRSAGARTHPARSRRYNAAVMVDDLRAVRDWIETARRAPRAAGGDRGVLVRRARRVRRRVAGSAVGGARRDRGADGARWRRRVCTSTDKGLPGRWLDGLVRRSFIRTVGVDPAEFDAERNLASIRVPVDDRARGE